MAAIIAQLSLANRRRKKRQREAKYIESDKCVYTLPPFDRCYQPMKHNKYLKNKAEFERRLHVAQKAKGMNKHRSSLQIEPNPKLCYILLIIFVKLLDI